MYLRKKKESTEYVPFKMAWKVNLRCSIVRAAKGLAEKIK